MKAYKPAINYSNGALGYAQPPMQNNCNGVPIYQQPPMQNNCGKMPAYQQPIMQQNVGRPCYQAPIQMQPNHYAGYAQPGSNAAIPTNNK